MERIVKVTGKGKIAVKPDLIRILIDSERTCESYEDAIKASASEGELLREAFVTLGFASSDLKTLHFNVDTEYENYQDEERNWKKRFLGYRYTHSLKLEFDADNEMLGRVLYQLSALPIRPEFRILYTVKDMEAAKNGLLVKAVEDSKEKAKILAAAAGVTLGDIVTIDYSWGEIDIVSSPMGKCMAMSAAPAAANRSIDIAIEPDDIDVSDTVTVVWGIR